MAAALSLHTYKRGNIVKSYVLMTGFILFVVLASYVFGEALGYGSGFVGIAVLFSIASTFASYFWGDKMILAMSRARPADRRRDFDYFTVAENLSIAAGIPKPKLYVIDDTAMNAFATGRDPEHGVIVATTGLLSRLDRRELEGVIAHEISHIRNYDIRLMAIVGVLVGTLAFLADMFMRSLWWGGGRRRDSRDGGGPILLIGIALAIITPMLAMIMQLAVSRRREYLADASGVELTRYPEGLARALEKLTGDREVLEAASNATAHLYIVNPFKGKKFAAMFSQLFHTHPPIEERVKILRSL